MRYSHGGPPIAKGRLSHSRPLLQGRVLRTFTAEELSFGSKTYEIGDITVLADGIKVELK